MRVAEQLRRSPSPCHVVYQRRHSFGLVLWKTHLWKQRPTVVWWLHKWIGNNWIINWRTTLTLVNSLLLRTVVFDMYWWNSEERERWKSNDCGAGRLALLLRQVAGFFWILTVVLLSKLFWRVLVQNQVSSVYLWCWMLHNAMLHNQSITSVGFGH